MAMHGRMPVIATIERGRQIPRRNCIRIAVQRVTDVVWIFFMNTSERQLRKPLRRFRIKHRRISVALRTNLANTRQQESQADDPSHS
jgi:hypothetical protein